MARLKSKKKASSSTLLSEVNDGVEAAEAVGEAEAKAPSPVTVDENSTQVTDNEENAVEKEVNEGVVAEAKEEVEEKDQIEENPDKDVALNQENVVDEVLNEQGGNTCDEKGEGEEKEKKIDEMDVYEEGKKEESVVEQEEKKEGDAMEVKAIEEENKGKGVEEKKDVVMEEDKKEEHVMEENSEQRPKPRKRIRKRKVVKKPVSVGGIEDKQAIVEEGKLAENSKEQQSVGIPEDNSGKQNIKSRKRNRRKKPLNKPDLLGRKKLKIGENDTQIEVKDVVEGEIVKENNGKELGESSKNKGNLKNNVGTSSKNGGKKVESMGMIFMCSSKTKQDCYIYKVLGLPAGKKNVVENIYKGMRLFLYDVDLKLLYGIYKASARGGYNLEPNAFNSQFPAQVRYQIVEDCLPLAEEKFRNIIKDNYYTRSKFNCQLNSEQVKNLCKLFVKTGKVSRSEKLVRGPPRSETTKGERGRKRRDEVRRPSFRDRDRNRPIAPLLRHPPTYGRPPTREVYMQEPPPRREVYREEPPHREVYRHEPPRREVYRHETPRREIYRHEPPRREVYRHEQPPREVYMHEPLREVYRHEPPPREMYRHEPPPREMYRLDHPHPPVERRESYAHPHMFNGQDVMKREPYTEQRHLEHHDPYRREPLMESYNRRVPLLEHSDSYRQLYGERKQLSLEPRRHNEMPNLEPRRQNEMPNLEMGRQNDRYNDNVYSTFQPRQMDTPSKGLLALYGPTTTTTTEAPPEYYPHDPFIGRLHH